MKTEIELRTGGRGWVAEDGRPTALGLVVSEHVDKIGFFEPAVSVVEKELLPDHIRFVLKHDNHTFQRLGEIIRGYRIGCFRIAREYGLVSPTDTDPIFAPDITNVNSPAPAQQPEAGRASPGDRRYAPAFP